MKTFFTPGPAALHPNLEKHIDQAYQEQVLSISHRSNLFQAIYQDTFESLKNLFNLPSGFAILFTGSATSIWEHLILNCVEENCFHLVNGSFSKRFYETAQHLKKSAEAQVLDPGQGFELADIQVHYKAELIALTQNETSTGVQMHPDDIHQLAEQQQQRLIVLDMVSSAPLPQLDFTKIDSAFLSVQKAFGLPAGLGVWIVNEKCLAKSESLENKGIVTGSYHRLSNLWSYFEKFQTPATPNVMGIYLLGRVAHDMLAKGMDKIRAESQYKAKLLYDFFDQDDRFEIFVKNKRLRSETVVVADTKFPAPDLINYLEQKDMIIGSGYRERKKDQIRVANFPAVSIEQVELLIQAFKDF